MTSIPVGEIAGRARQVRPGRVLLTAVSAAGVAIGWCIARFFRSAGWLAGRTWAVSWIVLAYFAETVIYGYREGAGLPQKTAARESQPGREPA